MTIAKKKAQSSARTEIATAIEAKVKAMVGRLYVFLSKW